LELTGQRSAPALVRLSSACTIAVQPTPREKSAGAARRRCRIARQDLGYFPAAWCDQSQARARRGLSATRDDADAVPAGPPVGVQRMPSPVAGEAPCSTQKRFISKPPAYWPCDFGRSSTRP